MIDRGCRPLLVGEDNPYSRDPRYALYPEPEHSAGGRLCRLVLGLGVKDYIRCFDRVNLCEGKWSAPEARRCALNIIAARGGREGGFGPAKTIVILGSKVAAAFGCDKFEPFKVSRVSGFLTYVALPHPSGRNRLWNQPSALAQARAVLTEAGILPVPASGVARA